MAPPSPVPVLVAVPTTLLRWPSESSWRQPELHGSPQRKQHVASPSEPAAGWVLVVGQRPWRTTVQTAAAQVLLLGTSAAPGLWFYLGK